MPELPEVETIARRLQTVLVGKVVRSVVVHHPKSFLGDVDVVKGATLIEISRRAKLIRIQLSNDRELLVHLKMTGQLIFQDNEFRLGGGHPTADWVQSLPTRHTRVSIMFADASQLFFNDMRIFGWIKVVTPVQAQREFSRYGPDITDVSVNVSYFVEGLARRSAPIKSVIMDSSWLAGVGNIYANDALFLANIDPRRAASSLSAAEADRLLQALLKVIHLGIETGGATISHYRDVDGFAGKYQDHVQVYQREGQPCLRCGREIVRIKQAGRSSFICLHCQK